MCGIVGAIQFNSGNCVPVLLEGLGRLEYRGYDSCGVAILAGGQLQRLRSTKRVAQLAHEVAQVGLAGSAGIAHTRWATHGAPATMNAHPHFSSGQGRQIALVHNGIIENYEALRAELLAQGYVFESQTDTEAVAHLIHSLYEGDILAAVQAACQRLQGAYALRSEEHTSELQSRGHLVCRLVLEKKKRSRLGVRRRRRARLESAYVTRA